MLRHRPEAASRSSVGSTFTSPSSSCAAAAPGRCTSNRLSYTRRLCSAGRMLARSSRPNLTIRTAAEVERLVLRRRPDGGGVGVVAAGAGALALGGLFHLLSLAGDLGSVLSR